MTVSDIDSTPTNAAGPSAEMNVAVLEIEQLRNRCLGNDQLVGQILGKIDRTLATELQRLRAALDQGDVEAVAALAHRLKGTAANIGAERFKCFAKKLEFFARQGEKTQMVSGYAELQQERDRLCQEINRITATGAPRPTDASTEVPR